MRKMMTKSKVNWSQDARKIGRKNYKKIAWQFEKINTYRYIENVQKIKNRNRKLPRKHQHRRKKKRKMEE